MQWKLELLQKLLQKRQLKLLLLLLPLKSKPFLNQCRFNRILRGAKEPKFLKVTFSESEDETELESELETEADTASPTRLALCHIH